MGGASTVAQAGQKGGAQSRLNGEKSIGAMEKGEVRSVLEGDSDGVIKKGEQGCLPRETIAERPQGRNKLAETTKNAEGGAVADDRKLLIAEPSTASARGSRGGETPSN